MKLGEVLKNVAVKSSYDESCEISSIAINSQKMEQGGLFIALSGKSQDGKKYIPDAIKNGAKVIAYDGE